MNTSATTLRLRMPAKAEYLVLGRLMLTGISRSHPLEAAELADLKLALTEACSNAVRHAYDQRDGEVEIRVELGNGFIAVEVLDDGPGFERVQVDGANPDDFDEGGLGLAIIETISDSSEIGRRVDGTGSRVRFVKLIEAGRVEEL